MAGAYSKVLDSPFRWPAFVHEARKLGYKSTEDIRGLLVDPKKRDDLMEAFQRTRDAMVDYGNLSPWEQRLVRRVVFFYPWVKGSTTYTGRFLRDHPIQAAVLGELGQYGQKKAQREIGEVPFYARGIFKTGQDEKGRPLVADPRSAQLFDYPVQGIEAIKGLAQRKGKPTYTLTNFLSPAASLPLQLLAPHDPLGGYSLPVPEALKRQYVSNLPQYLLQERLRHPTENDPDKLYPRSRKQAVGQFAVGGVYPHPVNVEELHKRAAEEKAGAYSPPQRAYRKVFEERQQLFEAVKRLMPEELEGGKLPKELRTAYNRSAEMARVRAQIDADTEPKTREREVAKYTAEVGLLKQWSLVTAAEAAEAIQWIRTATRPQIATQRDRIRSMYFEKAYLHGIRYAKNALEEKGASFD
jgi:hypothetical protein